MKTHAIILALILCVGGHAVSAAEPDTRPNIIWIMIEDWGPDLSCYGTRGIYTPNVDKLASEGVRYTNAFTTSPVCSTSRTAMMIGFHQNYIGAGQHRTRGTKLPYGIKPIPHLLEAAGYYTCLMSKKQTVISKQINNSLWERTGRSAKKGNLSTLR